MIRLLCTVLMVLTLFGVNAQENCNCLTDFDDAIHKLKQAKSYKHQINRKNKADFQKWVSDIRAEIDTESFQAIDCIAYISKAYSFIKDEHLAVYSGDEFPFEFLNFGNKGMHSKTLVKLYQGDTIYIADLYKDEKQTWAAVRYSKIEAHKKGDVIFRYWEGATGFEAIRYYSNKTSSYIKVKDEAAFLSNQDFVEEGKYSVYNSPNYIPDSIYFKSLSNEIIYVSMPTFNGSTLIRNTYKKLYADLFETIDASSVKHIIFDVRINGGGTLENFKALIEFLKSKQDNIQLHVITSKHCGSAGDYFVMDMRSIGAKIYGQNTKGAINYWFTDRSKVKSPTPCNNFKIRLTNANVKRLSKNRVRPELEVVGLQPDYYLNNDSYWLEQVLEIIKNGN